MASLHAFELEGGLRLVLWPCKSLAHDSGLSVTAPSPTDFCLAHYVSSKADMDVVMDQVWNASATIVKAAHDM